MDCPHIPQLSYGDFSQRLHQKIGNNRFPLSGSIEVTERCNLRCVHCYIKQPATDSGIREKELTTSQCCRIIDEIAEAGCLWLLLTGGEPFVREDFLEIYTHAKQTGLIITIFTNGTLLTPAIADLLAEWPPFAVEITLYGSSQETYEKVTGIPGSFKKCHQGINLLRDRRIPFRLKSMALTINRHEIKAMADFSKKLGADFRFDPVLNLRLDGSNGPAGYRLGPEEVVALDMGDPKRLQEWQEFCSRFLGAQPDPDRLYNCGAGNFTFHVNSHGGLSSCILARKPYYDIIKGSFREGWEKFLPTVLAQPWKKEVACRTCNLIAMCGQCPGFGQTEHGDPEKRVDYLCRIARLRAKALGISNSEEKNNEQQKTI